MLISDVQQSDSVIHIHFLYFVKFLSFLGCYRVLSRVPWTVPAAHRDPSGLSHTQNSLLCPSRSLLVTHFKSSSVYPFLDEETEVDRVKWPAWDLSGAKWLSWDLKLPCHTISQRPHIGKVQGGELWVEPNPYTTQDQAEREGRSKRQLLPMLRPKGDRAEESHRGNGLWRQPE